MMSNNENSKLKKKNKMLQENLTEFQNVTIILYREAVTLFQIELLINYKVRSSEVLQAQVSTISLTITTPLHSGLY